MSLFLYNTLTRRKEAFAPGDPNRVTMYVCGPTVYNYAHIGNARPVVVFDVLFRLLRQRHPNVVYARNYTDVDDKINAAAKAQNVAIDIVSQKFAAIYAEDMAALGALAPTLEPRATQHIGGMIAMIERLIAQGHAYAAEGHVLFNVPSYEGYGALSKRARDDMVAGARVEVAPYKKDPADFVLWKPSTPDLPGWDSPWGRGRPGWHIECSGMIETHLGETIDIHGGGNDLIFPHHENELAQSTCAHGQKPLARYWLHNGFLTLDKEKMSKSLGNFVTVNDLLKDHAGEAIRWALLSAHYRQPLDWSDDTLGRAKRTLNRLYGALEQVASIQPARTEPSSALCEALDDDLNTPKAMAELSVLAARLNQTKEPSEQAQLKGELLAGGALLGVLQQSPQSWLAAAPKSKTVDAAEVERLIAARNAARKARDFTEADRIRAQIHALGVTIEDRADGTRWRLTE
ncbi:MAG: cysteine--tRNA ligase [Rhodospirillaceae bacterium]|nr:cysteine--tRNA ligase [Rhodospirillaceae bacterium]